MKLPKLHLRDLFWLVPLVALLCVANLPRHVSKIASDAGFPWTFATLRIGQITAFHPTAFVLDALAGGLTVTLFAVLMPLCRRPVLAEPTK